MAKARKTRIAVRARAPKRKPARNRRTAEQILADLKVRLREVGDLRGAGAVLGWDQATYMPEGGAEARGRQMATLSRLAHERWVSAEVGKLLDALAPFGESLPRDNDDASLIRVARREYDKAVRVPPDWVARANAHGAASYDAWTRARPANDFATMVPYLEKTLALSREYSEFFVPYKHIADPHIDGADEGMTTASIRRLFDELRRELVPMVRAICDQPAADDSCLRQGFPKAAQFDFGLSVARRMGYDTTRGRLDLTHHPFCTRFSAGDVRITTRVNEHDLGDALFSTLHEAGHAMYEQGVRATLEGTPSATASRPACTRASRGSGKTSSRAAAVSGSISIRRCSASSRISFRACRLMRSIARSTRSRARSSAPMPTRSPTICTSCCASRSS